MKWKWFEDKWTRKTAKELEWLINDKEVGQEVLASWYTEVFLNYPFPQEFSPELSEKQIKKEAVRIACELKPAKIRNWKRIIVGGVIVVVLIVVSLLVLSQLKII